MPCSPIPHSIAVRWDILVDIQALRKIYIFIDCANHSASVQVDRISSPATLDRTQQKTDIETLRRPGFFAMRFVTFDPLRTLAIPDTTYIKPEHFLRHRDVIMRAQWLLFPDYWQVNALHYGLRARLFPSLASYHLGHDKVEMTRAFQTVCPENTPYTLILANSPTNRAQVLDEMPLPFVAKTSKSSQGRGVFLIETALDWERYCASHDVLYVQELLPARRDLRLALIGREVVGGYWREHPEGGFHNNVARGGRIQHGTIPSAALELVTLVAAKLGIDHAGFDLMEHCGRFYFLEFNRLFGNQGLTEQGIDPAKLIFRYLDSLGSQVAPPPA